MTVRPTPERLAELREFVRYRRASPSGAPSPTPTSEATELLSEIHHLSLLNSEHRETESRLREEIAALCLVQDAARAEAAELRRRLDAVLALFPREGSGYELVRVRVVSRGSDGICIVQLPPVSPVDDITTLTAERHFLTLPPDLRGEKASE